MKILKKIFLNSILLVSIFSKNIFGMEQKISNGSTDLQTLCNVKFEQDEKNILIRLSSACQNNNSSEVNSEINKINTLLKKKNNASELVCAALFLLVDGCYDKAALKLLAKKKMRIFLFKAFLPNSTKALCLLEKMVDKCIQTAHFQVLTAFINQVLLTTKENDRYHELPQKWNSKLMDDFIDNMGDSFKSAFEVAKEINNKNLLSSLERLGVSTCNSLSSDLNDSWDVEESSQDDEDDSVCSSDPDSEGDCFHTRAWKSHCEYLYEHKDD